MSLATRCTACSTVFRVVQDQLKVSEGWVRCGRCNEVFNALEGLFDLKRDTLPDSPVDARTPSVASTAAIGVDTDPRHADTLVEAAPARADAASSTDAIDKIDAQLMHARESGQLSTPATRIGERDRLEFPDAQFATDMLAEDPLCLHGPGTGTVAIEEPGTSPSPAVLQSAPKFAQRHSHAGSRKVRALKAAALATLLMVLGLQMLNQFRNEVAARWPATGPLLASWCSAMACTVAAPERIGNVVVESTALTRAAVPDALQLSVVLRNRGNVTVALPSIDLGLTDANGQLVARRMLTPRDFRDVTTAIYPGMESALQLVFLADGASITGYTVEVFYP